MMKNLLLKSSTVILFFMFSATSCIENPCMDIDQLNEYSDTAKEWFIFESAGDRPIIDNNGIKETLMLNLRRLEYFNDETEDDCGNSFDSFHFDVIYQTSFSPYYIAFKINSGKYLEDYYLKIDCRNNNSANSSTPNYNLINKTCPEGNAVITYLEDLQTPKKKYNDVLEITFKSVASVNDIKTVYYTKTYGLIKFILGNGNEFEID